MKFYLIVAKGTKEGMPIPITVDLFLIGADRMCQLRKPSLGAKHCALVSRDNKVFIRDLNSGQDTFVNGSLLPPGQEWPLHAGDRLEIGRLEFLIQMQERALSGKDLEEWAARCLDTQREFEEDEEAVVGVELKSAQLAAQSILDKLTAMKGSVKGRLRIGIDHGVTIVRFTDAMLIDESEIALLRKELCDHLNRPNLRILLDLKNVRRMSSQAVNMLSDFFRWVGNFGSTLAVCRIRPELRAALSILRVEAIPVFKDKRAAMAAKW